MKVARRLGESVNQSSTDRTPPSSGSWFALTTLLLVGALFAGNNLAPYFWLPSSGPMTMFAALTPRADNHLFMPLLPLGDSGVYVAVEGIGGSALDSPPGRTLRGLGAYAQARGFLLSLNLIRYQASLACATSANAQLQLSLRRQDGGRIEYENICVNPRELRSLLVPGLPDCNGCDYFRRFHREGQSAQ
jgi:hypothetical protein